MVDIDTTEAQTDEAEKAKPAAGRANDPAIVKLADEINRLMSGDGIDLRAPRTLAAA